VHEAIDGNDALVAAVKSADPAQVLPLDACAPLFAARRRQAGWPPHLGWLLLGDGVGERDLHTTNGQVGPPAYRVLRLGPVTGGNPCSAWPSLESQVLHSR
jgi:hypothetical protein